MDEKEIRTLVNSNIQRISNFLNSQVDDMKALIKTQKDEIENTLSHLKNFERDIKLNSVQLKQLQKEFKQTVDKQNESIFNVEERLIEFEKKT